MRLAFMHSASEWNGRARVFATVARALSERGHECWFLAPAGSVRALGLSAGADGLPLAAGLA